MPAGDPVRDSTPGNWLRADKSTHSGTHKEFLRERAEMCYLRTKDLHGRWSTIVSEAQLILTERASEERRDRSTDTPAVGKLVTKAINDHHARDPAGTVREADRLKKAAEANRQSKAELIIGKSGHRIWSDLLSERADPHPAPHHARR